VIVNAPQSPAVFFYDAELDATIFPLIIQHSLLMKSHNQYITMFHCRDGSCQAIDRHNNVSSALMSKNKPVKCSIAVVASAGWRRVASPYAADISGAYWIESNTWNPLFTAAMIFFGLLVHRKGLGSFLCSARKRLMAACSSTWIGTLPA
jgi:hypothetical protein